MPFCNPGSYGSGGEGNSLSTSGGRSFSSFPELLALHPEGRVPLLVHDLGDQKQVVYQSSIILEYLEEAFTKNPLMPKDPCARAKVRIWTYWCDQIFKPDLDLFKYEFSILDEKSSQALIQRLHLHLSYWDAALKNGPFLLGSDLTLADIHLFPFARQFFGIKPGFPGIERYDTLSIG